MNQQSSALDDIAANLPIDQLAARLGAQPAEVQRAVQAALPALLGGMQANAQDPGGEASLAEALGQHDNDLATPPVDVDEVDTADGEKITHHIFGAQQDQVVNQLGNTGASSDLVKKLLPILAPIVLSYLAKRMGGGAAGQGALGSILSQVLAGAGQGMGGQSKGSGSILGDLLGGLLGGGRKA